MSKGKRKAEGREEAHADGESRKRARTGHGQSAGDQNGDDKQQLIAEVAIQNRTSPESRDPEEESKKQRRKAKSEKRRLKTLNKAAHLQEPVLESKISGDTGAALTTLPNKRGKKSKSRDMDRSWSVSSAIGGCLRDLDPVFSIDEQYLLLAYESSIGVYATSTSFLIRTLPISKSGSITGFTISPSHPSHIYVCISSGIIEQWDWVEGRRMGKWDINSQIFHLTAAKPVAPEQQSDIVYTVDRKSQWMITAHRLRIGDRTELHTLLKSTTAITHVKVSEGGKYVVVSAGQRLIIGITSNPSPPGLRELSYTWREIECSEWITSLDVRMNNANAAPTDAQNSQSASSGSRGPRSLNITVGGLKGSIYVYQDLLGKLIRKEKRPNAAAPVAQRLHWHRNGVGAVKWSMDGNYIISGGAETVLLQWQLDTGRKQFLPHLSAAIESVVVSPSGSSYAVRLANNSAMVLSTTELEPTVTISGIQMPTQVPSALQPPKVASVTTSSPQNHGATSRMSATVSPLGTGQLLVAVPAESSSRVGIPQTSSATFLQTLDIVSGSQISKQALSRTKVTTLNMGPESNIIEEPHVTQLQISHDGQWLASIDEWTPPRQDIAPLTIDQQATKDEQISRIEVYLKFWSWNNEIQTWELVARIDAPHATETGLSQKSAQVLDLIADPSTLGFITLGVDGLVKSWRPRNRYRDGIEVHGKDGKPLTNWFCGQSTTLPTLYNSPDMENVYLPAAKLAVSADGSLLAVGYQSSSQSMVHLINTEKGDIHSTRSDLLLGTLVGIGIIDRYLILLSEELIVWDLVDDQLSYGFQLRSVGLQRAKATSATHLAVDQRNHTFAVAVPDICNTRESRPQLRAQLVVFDPAQSTPLSTSSLPRSLVHLLPVPFRKGYLAIDTTSEMRLVTPLSDFFSKSQDLPKVDKVTTAGLENLFGKTGAASVRKDGVEQLSVPGKATSKKEYDLAIEDMPVVRQKQLAEIFDAGPSFALPSVMDLFEQVAGLFSKTSVA